MRKATTCLVILAALVTTGCKSSGFLAKREAEKCCPTDIRKTVPWCAGEDALFKCPCEPSPVFYGYKPTCWRTWPTGGAAWRDTHCGNQHHDAIISDLKHQNPELIQLPALQSLPTPAKQAQPTEETTTDEEKGIELPKPSTKVEMAPKQAEVPRLREASSFEPAPEAPQITKPKPAPIDSQIDDVQDDLPLPILGPIPLPPIDDE